MRMWLSRTAVLALAGLWLAGCSASHGLFAKTAGADAADPNAPFAANASATAGDVPPPLGVPAEAEKGLLGADPNDDLSLGRKQYLAHNYGLAERHFRKAVELHPDDAEAWLGLAASYDRLRRFDLADRAYKQAIGIVGPTVAILNNQGFSYMLRGDYRRARAKLREAQRKEPGNKYVANNLRLLEESARKGKGIK